MDIKDVLNRHRDFLLALPNVEGVGIGPKVRQDVTTGELAIKVFVSRKLSPRAFAAGEPVPATLDGVPTDVEEMAPLRAH